MKISFLERTAALVVVLAAAAWAADVNGKWVAQVPGRSGEMRQTTITLKADGDKLTGSVSGRQSETPIQDAKISGDDISFVVVRNFGGNEVRMKYKGKVTGNEIKFTVESGDRTFETTAKRGVS